MTAPALARSTPTGRVYEHPITGKQVPSITSIIGIMDKPALKWWAAKQAAIYASENLDNLVNLKSKEEVVQLVKSAPFRKSDVAANIGDIVHDSIDRRIKGLPVDISTMPPTAAKCMRSFVGFEKEYNPKFIDSEFTVWSDTHGYAGTADWAAVIREWVTLGDTKTGTNVYPEVGMQIAAIANADYILEPDGTQRELPAFDRYAVLHVRPTFTRLVPLEHIDECFTAFCDAISLKRWKDEKSEKVIQAAPKIAASKVMED